MTAIERLLESGSIGPSTRGVGGLLLWGIARCAPRERVIACRAHVPPRGGYLHEGRVHLSVLEHAGDVCQLKKCTNKTVTTKNYCQIAPLTITITRSRISLIKSIRKMRE